MARVLVVLEEVAGVPFSVGGTDGTDMRPVPTGDVVVDDCDIVELVVRLGFCNDREGLSVWGKSGAMARGGGGVAWIIGIVLTSTSGR